MAFNQPTITQAEIDANNLEGLPDIPGYSTLDMQRALDKLATMVALKVNDLITAMGQAGTGVPTENEMAQAIVNAQISGGAGDMLQAVYDTANRATDIFALIDAKTATNTADIYLYVSSTGDDTTGDGTATDPYATIQKAINELPKHLTANATIYVDGNTPGGINIEGFSGGGTLSIEPLTAGQTYTVPGAASLLKCSCPIVVTGLRSSIVLDATTNSAFSVEYCSGFVDLNNCGFTGAQTAGTCYGFMSRYHSKIRVINAVFSSGFTFGYSASGGGEIVILGNSGTNPATLCRVTTGGVIYIASTTLTATKLASSAGKIWE